MPRALIRATQLVLVALVVIGLVAFLLLKLFGEARVTTDKSGTQTELLGAACSGAEPCWAVGPGGAIMVRSGGSWSAQNSGSPANLFAVTCPDPKHCWAVGRLQQSLHAGRDN